MQIFVDTNFDFLKWRIPAVLLSLAIIAAGVIGFFARGMNLGIDFAGGTAIVLRFQEQVPIDQLRGIIGGATIQRYGAADENSVLIRLPQQEVEGDHASAVVAQLNQEMNSDLAGRLDLNLQGRGAIAELLARHNPDNQQTGPEIAAHYSRVAGNIMDRRSDLGLFTRMDQVTTTPGLSPAAAQVITENAGLGRFNVLSQETVGPAIGRELQQKAILAIILATLAMGIYIAIRFDIAFGLAGILALMHDVAIALSAVLLLGLEINILTIAAFLMIVGYSINDSVVIYDRVRENKRKDPRMPLSQQINNALNQTLARTFLTSGTVWLVLIAIIIFGGQVLNQFGVLLLIGTIAGTYSTLTIIPAFVLAWEKWRGNGGPSKAAARASVEREQRARA
jgi:preprotein translocase subunit SecF